MGVAFLAIYLCISILEFKLNRKIVIGSLETNLCISILEFKYVTLF